MCEAVDFSCLWFEKDIQEDRVLQNVFFFRRLGNVKPEEMVAAARPAWIADVVCRMWEHRGSVFDLSSQLREELSLIKPTADQIRLLARKFLSFFPFFFSVLWSCETATSWWEKWPLTRLGNCLSLDAVWRSRRTLRIAALQCSTSGLPTKLSIFADLWAIPQMERWTLTSLAYAGYTVAWRRSVQNCLVMMVVILLALPVALCPIFLLVASPAISTIAPNVKATSGQYTWVGKPNAEVYIDAVTSYFQKNFFKQQLWRLILIWKCLSVWKCWAIPRSLFYCTDERSGSSVS